MAMVLVLKTIRVVWWLATPGLIRQTPQNQLLKSLLLPLHPISLSALPATPILTAMASVLKTTRVVSWTATPGLTQQTSQDKLPRWRHLKSLLLQLHLNSLSALPAPPIPMAMVLVLKTTRVVSSTATPGQTQQTPQDKLPQSLLPRCQHLRCQLLKPLLLQLHLNSRSALPAPRIPTAMALVSKTTRVVSWTATPGLIQLTRQVKLPRTRLPQSKLLTSLLLPLHPNSLSALPATPIPMAMALVLKTTRVVSWPAMPGLIHQPPQSKLPQSQHLKTLLLQLHLPRPSKSLPPMWPSNHKNQIRHSTVVELLRRTHHLTERLT